MKHSGLPGCSRVGRREPETGEHGECESCTEVIDLLEEVRTEKETVEALRAELVRLKDVGNVQFKAGKYEEAVAAYKSALAAAKKPWKRADEAKAIICPLLISLHSNLAATHLKWARLREAPLQEYHAAEAAATDALGYDAKNVKALYRRGVARAELGRLATAKDDLVAACRADPKDRTARDELDRVQEKLRSQKASREAASRPKSRFAAPPISERDEEKELARRRAQEQTRESAERALEESLGQPVAWRGATKPPPVDEKVVDALAADVSDGVVL